MNLGRYIRRTAEFTPHAPAITCGGHTVSYAQLDDDSDRIATALRNHGMASGGSVATLAHNCAELPVVEAAIYKAGLTRVPINARLSEHEVTHLLLESEARVLFVGSAHVPLVLSVLAETKVETLVTFGQDIQGDDAATTGVDLWSYHDFRMTTEPEPVEVECAETDIAVLHFTSGSTGKLKAAVQTYGNRIALMRKMLMGNDTRVGPGDKQILAGPITHASGMPLMSIFFSGGCAIVMDRWDPEQFLSIIEHERATHAFVIPMMVNSVLALPNRDNYDLSSMRQLFYGAAPMSPQRIRQAWDFFGPVLAQGYGCGETTSGVMFLSTEDHRRAIDEGDDELLSSCGRPTTEAEVALLDDAGNAVPDGEIGQIAVRGPDVVDGYFHEPELTAESFRDGWFFTGDLARRRSDGFIFILDRKKDMIISGGFNIYAAEVEAVLDQHDDVYESAVVGVPDDQWGEAVKAIVVPRNGATADETELVALCTQNLASMKKPQSIEFTDALPRNPNGKLDRRAVRDRYWSPSARQVN